MKFLVALISIFIFSTLGFAQARPPLTKPYLKAPLVLDGRPLSEVWIFPRDSHEDFAVEAKSFIEAFGPILKDDLLVRLKESVSAEGVVSLASLQALGFSVTFDPPTLELRLGLPPKYRKPQDLSLNFIEYGNQKYQRPDQHSGYLNLRTQQTWQYGPDVESKKGPLTGNLEFVENIKGFVFETSADFSEGSDDQWRRQDTRLRYDDEERMIRYTLGDLSFRSTGFQVTPSIAGLAATREFAIQPYKTLRPLSDTEIVIKRTSLVEVYVNGLMFSQVRLAPGVFNIRDFPLATGQSNVRIKIKDDLGQEEVYDFSLLFENSLLARGVEEFSYAAGLPWQSSGGDRAYDDPAAFVSLYNRRGVTDRLTVGLNYQSYFDRLLVGGEISGVSEFGYLSLQAAQGSESSNKGGFAERLTYRSLDKVLGRQMPLLVSLEFENQDPDFTPVTVQNTVLDPLRYVRRYDLQLNFRLDSSWLFGVGGNTLEFLNGVDQRTYRSNLMIPVASQMRFEVVYNKILKEEAEDRVLLSFYWNESQGLYSASSYYDSLQKTTNVSVSRANRYQYDDFRWNVNTQNNEQGNIRNLSGEYLKQPFAVRLNHMNSAQTGGEYNLTSLGLNTGFAWVGGHGAFTQPVTDSFVLLHSKRLETDQSLMINPTGDRGQAQLGPRKTVVLRDQSSYYRNTVNIDSTSLPMGYLLDKEFYGIQNTYRSGILLDLNISKRIMIKGQLQKSDGSAVAYVAGDVFDSRGHLIDNTFFTNKQGRFLIEGLEPGVYRVVTDQSGLAAFEFTVPENAEKMLNLGVVKVGSKESR